jgi:hypothetical protein
MTRHQDLRDQMQEISDYLVAHLDCNATLTGTACGGPTSTFPLYDKSSGTAVAIGPWTDANGASWSVSGSCDGTTLTAQVSRLSPSGTPVVDRAAAGNAQTLKGFALSSNITPNVPTCAAFFNPALVGTNCMMNPSQTLQTCSGRTTSNAMYCVGDPDDSWQGWAECGAGEIVTSCGMTTTGASPNPGSGHYIFAVGAGATAASGAGVTFHTYAHWGCVCDFGTDLFVPCTNANIGQAYGAPVCQAFCVKGP